MKSKQFKLTRKEIEDLGFKYSHKVVELNTDYYKKGKDYKLLIMLGEDDKVYEFPKAWLIYNNLTMFKGIIKDISWLKTIVEACTV